MELTACIVAVYRERPCILGTHMGRSSLQRYATRMKTEKYYNSKIKLFMVFLIIFTVSIYIFFLYSDPFRIKGTGVISKPFLSESNFKIVIGFLIGSSGNMVLFAYLLSCLQFSRIIEVSDDHLLFKKWLRIEEKKVLWHDISAVKSNFWSLKLLTHKTDIRLNLLLLSKSDKNTILNIIYRKVSNA